jgi:hypothetical protein
MVAEVRFCLGWNPTSSSEGRKAHELELALEDEIDERLGYPERQSSGCRKLISRRIVDPCAYAVGEVAYRRRPKLVQVRLLSTQSALL